MAETAAAASSRKIGIAMEEKSANYVFPWVIDNILKAGDEIYLLHCEADPSLIMATAAPGLVGFPEAIGMSVSEYQENRRKQESDYKHFVHDYNEQLKEHGHKVHAMLLRADDPRDAMVEATKALNLDILIVGNRGLGTVKRALLGSVSSYVVHHCACPVIVVRTDNDLKERK